MSGIRVGYEGDGRARKPIVLDEGPRFARMTGYVTGASTHGYPVIGGALVQGESGTTGADHQRAYKARRRAAQS